MSLYIKKILKRVNKIIKKLIKLYFKKDPKKYENAIPCMIVPVLTNHKILNRMIGSIRFPIQNLVIVDNGSSKKNWKPRKSKFVNRIWHIKMPSNLGVPGSWNLGIKSLPRAQYWLISNFDVIWTKESLQEFAKKSNSKKLLLSNGQPRWCAFSVGWEVIRDVGLFDESFVPAYYEDNDFENRCNRLGINVEHSDIYVYHENSSTLASGFQEKNQKSFPANEEYFKNKINNEDFSEGKWSIERRRDLGWD